MATLDPTTQYKESTIYKEVKPLALNLFPELKPNQAVAVYLLALNGHSQVGNLLKISSATVSYHINIAKHILKVNTTQELKLIAFTRLAFRCSNQSRSASPSAGI